jgi:ketosteroid isomerase-like protein
MRLLPSYGKLRSLGIVTILFVGATLQGGAALAQKESASTALGPKWVERLTVVMMESATKQDIDNLLALYADDIVYEHPRMGARTQGKRQIRKGMSQYLGATRNPSLRIKSTIAGRNVIVLELELRAEAKQNTAWEPLTRTQVTVLETDGSHIRRVIDYW